MLLIQSSRVYCTCEANTLFVLEQIPREIEQDISWLQYRKINTELTVVVCEQISVGMETNMIALKREMERFYGNALFIAPGDGNENGRTVFLFLF